ncbi:MAG TPA: hypothetical protein VNL77_06460 [Roseiflexaceae bacterium]|nr:hypothetical protein [Roseiflexaceae bacterium]
MGEFVLISLGLLVVSILLAAWRRRGAVPYDDPHMTVEALRERQRCLYEFGMAPGPPLHAGQDQKPAR